jgi:hypothetical protein
MAQLEMAMWRDYHSQHWLALLGHTWRASRQQYGFSRWDSLRLAWRAARAARAFQHDTNNPAALSAMTDYYRVVAPSASGTFDACKGAVWEVQWWRQRRESAPPAEWARTITALRAWAWESAWLVQAGAPPGLWLPPCWSWSAQPL